MTPDIASIIAQIPAWQGQPVTVAPLSGGLTNSNYTVTVAGVRYVVRLPGPSTALLAVNRANELHNTRAAAEAGTSPRVVHYLPEQQVMVLEFIPGQTMSIAALQAPGMPARMARSLRRLHAGPRFLAYFNMFRLVEQYLRTV